MLLTFLATMAYGQSASTVLDAAAKKLTSGGTYANFTVTTNGNNIWGNIAIKGEMFKITSEHAITWYDGKTQWTYMNGTEEVTISNPDEEQQQQINPYHFINLYKKGYNATLKKNNGINVVTLKRTTAKSDISDAVIDIDTKTGYPVRIQVKSNGEWSVFKISNAKRVNYYTSHFRFPEKKYNNAEVIDLR